jgi:LemA protein
LIFCCLGHRTPTVSAEFDAFIRTSTAIGTKHGFHPPLFPNLVNAVKGYAQHEKATFESVTQARNMALNAGNLQEQMQAENMISNALRSLFAVAEAYPELKANTNFLQLQSELTDTESKIAYARQFYNDTVQKFNTKIELFPNNLVAGMLGFAMVDYFTLQGEPDARQAVKVEF